MCPWEKRVGGAVMIFFVTFFVLYHVGSGQGKGLDANFKFVLLVWAGCQNFSLF